MSGMDKTGKYPMFQYRLHLNSHQQLTMKIHVVKDRAYFGMEGMMEPFVVIEGYPVEISVALGPSNSTLIEAVRIMEKRE